MASLRELFVTLGINYDGAGAKKAKDDLGDFKKGANKAGGAAKGAGDKAAGFSTGLFNLSNTINVVNGVAQAFHGVGAAVTGVLTAGSDVQETENILGEVFKSGAEDVKRFAKTTGKEIGRSQFQLREYAGIIGALVSPQLQGMGAAGQEAAQNISTDFAKLSIDLASFFNSSEEDALLALRSGVSGETEPLKRFGINLTGEGISNALGISKKQLTKMTVAEKTMARYRAIMILTKNAQGDAARTADGYANVVRKLESTWKDLQSRLGQAIIPIATKVASAVTKLIEGVQWLGRETRFFESVSLVGLAAGLIAITGVFKAMGLAGAVAWLKILGPALLVGVAIAALILVIEDVWTAMAGGDSVIGGLIDKLTGTEGSLLKFRENMERMGAAIYDVLQLDFEEWSVRLSEGLDIIGQKIWDFISGPFKKLAEIGEKFGIELFGDTEGERQVSSRVQARRLIQNPNAAFSAPGAPASSSVANNQSAAYTVNIMNPQGNPRDIARENEKIFRNLDRERNRRTREGV